MGPEVAYSGLKHNGLDDLTLESVLVLCTLYARGQLDEETLIEVMEIGHLDINDHIDTALEYSLLDQCPTTGDYVLTDKGVSACSDIFYKVVVRKRIELKSEVIDIERMYSKLDELL